MNSLASSCGIVPKLNCSLLANFGGPETLNKDLDQSQLRQINFIQRKETTAKSNHTVGNSAELKEAFPEEAGSVITMEEIPPESILNWDQTGITHVSCSCSSWMME